MANNKLVAHPTTLDPAQGESSPMPWVPGRVIALLTHHHGGSGIKDMNAECLRYFPEVSSGGGAPAVIVIMEDGGPMIGEDHEDSFLRVINKKPLGLDDEATWRRYYDQCTSPKTTIGKSAREANRDWTYKVSLHQLPEDIAVNDSPDYAWTRSILELGIQLTKRGYRVVFKSESELGYSNPKTQRIRFNAWWTWQKYRIRSELCMADCLNGNFDQAVDRLQSVLVPFAATLIQRDDLLRDYARQQRQGNPSGAVLIPRGFVHRHFQTAWEKTEAASDLAVLNHPATNDLLCWSPHEQAIRSFLEDAVIDRDRIAETLLAGPLSSFLLSTLHDDIFTIMPVVRAFTTRLYPHEIKAIYDDVAATGQEWNIDQRMEALWEVALTKFPERIPDRLRELMESSFQKARSEKQAMINRIAEMLMEIL